MGASVALLGVSLTITAVGILRSVVLSIGSVAGWNVVTRTSTAVTMGRDRVGSHLWRARGFSGDTRWWWIVEERCKVRLRDGFHQLKWHGLQWWPSAVRVSGSSGSTRESTFFLLPPFPYTCLVALTAHSLNPPQYTSFSLFRSLTASFILLFLFFFLFPGFLRQISYPVFNRHDHHLHM